jgi:hypothetical protein
MLANWPPLKLAKLALAGSMLIAVEAFVPVCFLEIFGAVPSYFAVVILLLLIFLPLLIGGPLTRIAIWRLSDGLDKDQWTEDEVTGARHFVYSPVLRRNANWYFWIVRAIVIFVLALWVASHIWKFYFSDVIPNFVLMIWLLRVPIDNLSKLRVKLLPKPPAYDPEKGGGGKQQRLHSDHWGARTVPNYALPERYDQTEILFQREEAFSPLTQSIVGLAFTMILALWLWSHHESSQYRSLAVVPFLFWFGWGLAHELRNKRELANISDSRQILKSDRIEA